MTMKCYVRIHLIIFHLIVLFYLAVPVYGIEKNAAEQKAESDKALEFTDYKSLKGPELIRMVQLALKDSGFDPGPIDGILGPKTRKAIIEFQNKSKLKPTGEIDDQTKDQLFWSF
jgi:peptidoglycan hydrolase-like protein with peptidoglycan-binding domain